MEGIMASWESSSDSFEYQVWIKNKYPEYEQEGRNNPIIIINQDY
ncbi:unnamed protein product, partial [Allacma fusca]